MNRLIAIGELADLKAVSVDTIRRWEKDGKIESIRTEGSFYSRIKAGWSEEDAICKN